MSNSNSSNSNNSPQAHEDLVVATCLQTAVFEDVVTNLLGKNTGLRKDRVFLLALSAGLIATNVLLLVAHYWR